MVQNQMSIILGLRDFALWLIRFVSVRLPIQPWNHFPKERLGLDCSLHRVITVLMGFNNLSSIDKSSVTTSAVPVISGR